MFVRYVACVHSKQPLLTYVSFSAFLNEGNAACKQNYDKD